MSNDKPIAIAITKFYANRHVEVELDTILGITPRTLSIGGHILQKTYAGMKGKHVANEHRLARERRALEALKAEKDDAEFHKGEDERLLAAAMKDMPSGGDANKESEAKESEAKSAIEKIKDAITG